ncbi:transglutaminase family protein [Aliikangiella sp. IMCC44653]
MNSYQQSFTSFGQSSSDNNLPLLSIICAQQSVLLPLYFYVPLWISIINTLVLGLVIYQVKQGRFNINRWLKLCITLLTIGLVIISYRNFSGKDVGLALITAMYGLKIMETRNYKEASALLSISFFMLVAAFLFSQSPLMALYQLIPFGLILNAFLALNTIQPTKKNANAKPKTQLIRQLCRYLLFAIPIMLLLFVFFPRLNGPIWRMPSSGAPQVAFSDNMSPGEISNLQLSDRVAFRVMFEQSPPPETQFYWRVLTLPRFDGINWTKGERRRIDDIDLSKQSYFADSDNIFDYTITLEATQQNYLVSLDRPVETPRNASLFDDFTVKTRYPIQDRLRYQVSSAPALVLSQTMTPEKISSYLQLPQFGNNRTKQWAKEFRSSFDTDRAFIQGVLQHINQQEFFYTLQPPILERDLVDSFWLDERKGFCEHYAGALVFIARAAGIPARVVIGFQGGEKNTLSDYWIVRDANAHAWTEVWFEGTGWLRIDPTVAIAAHRVEERLLGEYRQRDSLFDDFEVVELDNIGWLKQLEYWSDELNNRWNDWVLDYNGAKQRSFFSLWGIDRITPQQLIIGMVIGLLFFAATVSLKFMRQVTKASKIEKGFALLIQKAIKLGAKNISASTGPYEILKLIKTLPSPESHFKKQQLEALLLEYINIRYQCKTEDESTAQQWFKKVRKI